MTIVEFIEARLADEAAAAQAVRFWGETQSSDPVFVHIAQHSPERTLRRVTADLALIASADDAAVKLMAQVWSDHPDFDGEWA